MQFSVQKTIPKLKEKLENTNKKQTGSHIAVFLTRPKSTRTQKISNKRTNNPAEKWAKDINEQLTEEIQWAKIILNGQNYLGKIQMANGHNGQKLF